MATAMTQIAESLVDAAQTAYVSGSEQEFHALLDALPVAAYTCDSEGLITYFNQPAVQLWGRSPQLRHPDDRYCGSFRLFSTSGEPIRHDACWMALALKQNRRFNRQQIIVELPTGERLDVLAHANPLHDSTGTLVGAVNILINISESVRAANALAVSETRYRTLIDAISSVVWLADAGGQIHASQPSWKTFTGLSEDRQLGYGWLESIHLEDRDHLKAQIGLAAASRQPLRTTGRIWSAGTHAWRDFDLNAAPILAADGSVQEWIGVITDITDHKQARARNRRFGYIFQDSINEIYVFDATTLKFLEVNRSARDNIGYSMDELRNLTPLDLKPKITRSEYEALIQPLRDGERRLQVFETVQRRKDGSLYDSEVHLQLLNSDGEQTFVAIILDISARRADQDRIQRFSRIFEDSLNEIFLFDAATLRFVQVNGAAQRNLGYTMDELREMTPVDIKPKFTVKDFADLVEPLRDGRKSVLVFETVHQRKDQSLYDVEVHLQLLVHGQETLFAAIILDVTDRKRSNRLLTYQASHDSLTGLINRREFERRAEQILDATRASGASHALCFLDLDQFKVVNDTCGHSAGDELLRQLTTVLERRVRSQDTVARLGGDEFGIFMEDCEISEAQHIATSIRDAIQNFKFSWQGLTFRVGVSIGLVPIVDTLGRFSDLLKEADTACYLAKEAGRNRIHIFHADDAEVVRRQGEMQWVSRLHKALDQNRFFLNAQAIVPVAAGLPMHYEVLTRMYDESGQVIPPGAFLPAAERYGLSSRLDHWVIRNAIGILENHPDFVQSIGCVSINLSGQSLLNMEILNYIIGLIELSGIDGHKLCFEITETAAIANLSVATKFIHALRKFGVQFALDDFGSGFSSFAYLKNLPVDYLKIDGLFVKDILDDPIDQAMVKSINEIGKVMGLRTIAEHVENDRVRQRLVDIGVDYVQGYGVERPKSIADLLGESDPIPNPKRVPRGHA